MRTLSKRDLSRRLPDDPKVLQDTIALMESRLRRLGDGDCAYEKAMIRFYQQQLVLHRARLGAQYTVPVPTLALVRDRFNGMV